MDKPLVSIIVTTKNEEKNIGRLLESIKNQSYKNIEVVVVDNRSTDKTKVISKRYTKSVYNKGPERSAQRNFGVSKSKGKYVLILDADMELEKEVVWECVEVILSSSHKALIIPEKTMGNTFMARVRRFEREMYIGDTSIEVARFFDKKIFKNFGGYDTDLTGAEDYDLPYRISKKYTIGRIQSWIKHHESDLTFTKQLKKKYYYAGKSAHYAKKHPELVATQGNMLFRKAYLKHWYKFFLHPFYGVSFIIIRIFETMAAVLGYIKAVGISEFVKTVLKTIEK